MPTPRIRFHRRTRFVYANGNPSSRCRMVRRTPASVAGSYRRRVLSCSRAIGGGR